MSNEQENQKKFKPNGERKVLVKSKALFNEKVIVVYKKIKLKAGPGRELYNIYLFNNHGETVMTERDAILFYKDRESKEAYIGDTTVFSVERDFEYDVEKIADLYKIETKEGLDDSSQK